VNRNLLLAAVEEEADVALRRDLSAAAAPAPAVIDRRHALERLGGDEELLAEVIRLFLEDCPQQLAAIKSAVDARDGEHIRSAAHALKGAAGNLSATDLFKAAEVMERLGAEGRVDAAQAAWRTLSAQAAHAMDVLRRLEPQSAAAEQ
jgi:HPt (histidine-containing phosphotransfer) domain-containing protein